MHIENQPHVCAYHRGEGMTWMVRVWLDAWDEECFIDDMHDTEYNFATESEAKMFKDSYNKKFSNYGGWKPHIVRGHRYGSIWVPDSPAEGPYFVGRQLLTVSEALESALDEADAFGLAEASQ